MTKPQVVWAYTAAVVAILGVASAWLTAPLTAAMLAITASLVACAAMNLRSVIPSPLRIAAITAVTAIATVAATGLVSIGGVVGLTIVGVVVLTAPPTVAAARALQNGHLRATPTGSPYPSAGWPRSAQPMAGHPGRKHPPAGGDEPRWSPWDPATISAFSDEELCRAWQASYVALQRQPLGDHRAIAAFRAAVLDELQARHPGAFTRWINDGARAASNPARYITNSRHPPDTAQPDPGETGAA